MGKRHPQAAGKKAIAFIDGQNLFFAAKEAFGHTYPNYDVKVLINRICSEQGWVPSEIRFYTGVPEAADNSFWNHFWRAKLAQMGRSGVTVYSRPLRYSNVVVNLPNGKAGAKLVGREKGIDIRIALEMVRAAYEIRCDVMLLLSQDQDLTEAVDEVKAIGKRFNKTIHVACAYPCSPTAVNTRGIDRTQWIKIDRACYDACLDPRDYRPKAFR